MYIYSYATSPESLLVYGTDGTYKKKIKNDNIKPNIDKILSIGNNIVITMPPVIPNYYTAELVLFDPIANIVIDSIADYNKIKSKDSFVNIEFPVSVSSIYNDNLYYMSVFADTPYKVSPTKIEPFIVFDYGKYKKDIIPLRGDQHTNAVDNTIRPMKLLATKEALYIQFNYYYDSQMMGWITKLDLSNGKVENYDTQFSNDIDNGPDYSISYFGNSMLIDIATLLATNAEQVQNYKNNDAQGRCDFTKILRGPLLN